jgi:molybdate transport system regulatory protein
MYPKGHEQIKSKVWLEKEGKLVFGSGKAMILKYIARTGSLAKAAKELKMSYRHAWSYIKAAEKRIGRPLMVCSKGGENGGGTLLTDYARELLEKFVKLEQKVEAFTDKSYREIF